MIAAIRRALIASRIRLLEVELADLSEALRHDWGPGIARLIEARQEVTRRELVKARGQWTALHPPGVRFTWAGA